MIWNHLARVTFLGRIDAHNLRYSALHDMELSSVVIQPLLTAVYTLLTKTLCAMSLRALKHNSDKEVAVLFGLQCLLLLLSPNVRMLVQCL